MKKTGVEFEFCPLCGAAGGPPVPVFRRPLHACPACELLWVPRSCHLSSAGQQARYRNHQNSLTNSEYVRRFEILIAAWEALPGVGAKHAPPPRRVLDFGCGPGDPPVLVELLRRRGCDALGYDPFFAPQADRSRPFDAVFAVETFEHFCGGVADVAEAVKCVRPGGHLVASTLFHSGPSAAADWWYARDPTHVCFYSRRTMEWIADHFALRLVACDDKNLCIFAK